MICACGNNALHAPGGRRGCHDCTYAAVARAGLLGTAVDEQMPDNPAKIVGSNGKGDVKNYTATIKVGGFEADDDRLATDHAELLVDEIERLVPGLRVSLEKVEGKKPLLERSR